MGNEHLAIIYILNLCTFGKTSFVEFHKQFIERLYSTGVVLEDSDLPSDHVISQQFSSGFHASSAKLYTERIFDLTRAINPTSSTTGCN